MKKKETQSTDFNLISPIAQLVSEGLTWLTKLLIDSLSGSIKALMEMMKNKNQAKQDKNKSINIKKSYKK